MTTDREPLTPEEITRHLDEADREGRNLATTMLQTFGVNQGISPATFVSAIAHFIAGALTANHIEPENRAELLRGLERAARGGFMLAMQRNDVALKAMKPDPSEIN